MVQHITERKRGQQLSAPTQSDGCDGLHGTFREGQIAPKIPSNKGLQPAISPSTIREVQYSRLSETALLSADSCLRSAVQGRNPKASVPGWAKLSSLRQLAVSPNSRAEPKKVAATEALKCILPLSWTQEWKSRRMGDVLQLWAERALGTCLGVPRLRNRHSVKGVWDGC